MSGPATDEQMRAWEREERETKWLEMVTTGWDELGSNLGLPFRLLPADLDIARSTLAVKAARQYLDNGDFAAGRCLVLSGPTGVGKSWAAAGVMKAAPFPCARRFRYFPGVCAALLDSERRGDALDLVLRTRLMILDDFGSEYLKAGGMLEASIDEIVWTREAQRRPTVMTTNLTAEQLRERLSDRIVDRLRGEWGRVVECPGESLREPEPHPRLVAVPDKRLGHGQG